MKYFLQEPRQNTGRKILMPLFRRQKKPPVIKELKIRSKQKKIVFLNPLYKISGAQTTQIKTNSLQKEDYESNLTVKVLPILLHKGVSMIFARDWYFFRWRSKKKTSKICLYPLLIFTRLDKIWEKGVNPLSPPPPSYLPGHGLAASPIGEINKNQCTSPCPHIPVLKKIYAIILASIPGYSGY